MSFSDVDNSIPMLATTIAGNLVLTGAGFIGNHGPNQEH
jgi:hypothetical protein